ncbi:hypothetical protein XACM_0817 [Xanthomonas euvesicatoria pv. citrumelo F1]|nr:hypothetical protein XACM_0817 [Xanthomonas euvesicatoria pv. citrumelo F1]
MTVNTASGRAPRPPQPRRHAMNTAHLAHADSRLCASTVPQRASAGLPLPAPFRLWADRGHLNAPRLAPCHPLL